MRVLFLTAACALFLNACAKAEEKKDAPAAPAGACDKGFTDSYNAVIEASRELNKLHSAPNFQRLKTSCEAFFTAYPDHVCSAKQMGFSTIARSEDRKKECDSTLKIEFITE